MRIKIRENMLSALEDDCEESSKVIESSRYMVLNNLGRLYRPILLLATARDYSVELERALPIASAVEFVHVASLIADDMMDNSDIRRGKESCHKIYGRDVAQLTHLYLREIAEKMIMEENDFSDKQKVSIATKASQTGIKMILGQERDVLQIGLSSANEIIKMYEQKSGYLIGMALASGGIIGNAKDDDIENLRKLGVSIGVSHQIHDDFLDRFASISETGKPERQDEKKNTLLKVIGIEEIKKLKLLKDREGDVALESLEINPVSLKEVIAVLRQRENKYLD